MPHKTNNKVVVTYTGQGISLNDWYSAKGGFWRRKTLKDKYSAIFNSLLSQQEIPEIKQFTMDLEFNSRHDTDNTVAMLKMFVDTLKGKYIREDTKEFYKGLTIKYDSALPKSTYVFTINLL